MPCGIPRVHGLIDSGTYSGDTSQRRFVRGGQTGSGRCRGRSARGGIGGDPAGCRRDRRWHPRYSPAVLRRSQHDERPAASGGWAAAESVPAKTVVPIVDSRRAVRRRQLQRVVPRRTATTESTAVSGVEGDAACGCPLPSTARSARPAHQAPLWGLPALSRYRAAESPRPSFLVASGVPSSPSPVQMIQMMPGVVFRLIVERNSFRCREAPPKRPANPGSVLNDTLNQQFLPVDLSPSVAIRFSAS